MFGTGKKFKDDMAPGLKNGVNQLQKNAETAQKSTKNLVKPE